MIQPDLRPLLSLVLLSGSLSLPLAAADLLVDWRDRLLSQLAERVTAQQESARDWRLTASEAFEGEDLVIHLHRRGEAWVGTRLEGVPEAIRIDAIETDGLQLEPGRLQGELVIRWHEAAVNDLDGRRWDRIGAPDRRRGPQTTSLQIDSRWRDDLLRYQLTLVDGIKDSPVQVHLVRDGETWVESFIATPGYNRGVHEIDLASLTVSGDRIAGATTIVYHPDKWVPEDRKPRTQTYTITATLQGAAIAGSHTATGQLGELGAAVSGTVSRVVDGSVVSEGPFGTVYGSLDGVIQTPHLVVPELAAQPDPATCYRQIAALRHALAHPAASWSTSLARGRGQAPTGDQESWRAALAAFAAAAEATPLYRGTVTPADPGFGPWAAIRPWSSAALADLAPSTWLAPTAWQLCGPFTIDRDAAEPNLPEALALAGASYPPLAEGGDTVTTTAADTFAIPPRPLEQFFELGKLATSLWVGATSVELPSDQRLWIAVRVDDGGQLWCDGRLVWSSVDGDQGYDSTRFAILPLDLAAGTHRFDLRCRARLEGGGVEFYLRPGGEPSGSDDPATATTALPTGAQGFRGDGSARFPAASAPIAWDLDTGRNLAWRQQLPAGSGDPVVWDDTVFVCAAPNRLHALALSDGSQRWQQDIGPAWAGEGLVTTSPLADAERVYALSHHGHLIACDHQGGVVWTAATGLDSGRGIGLPAPVRCGGLVVIQGYRPDPDSDARKKHQRVASVVVAFDAGSGAEAWRIDPLPTTGRLIHKLSGQGYIETYRDDTGAVINGISPISLSRDGHRRDLIVSSHGHIIDATSGELLARVARSATMNRCAPYVDGTDCFFTTPLGQSGLRFWLTDTGTVAVRELWRDRRRFYLNAPEDSFSSRGTWHKGPVLRDGLLYVQRQTWNHWPKHHPKPYCEVTTYERDSGLVAGTQRKTLWKATNPVGNPASIGDHLFFTDSGDGKYDGIVEHGQVAVALPGPRPLVIADNDCGKLYSTPVAAGDRLLLRTMDGLTCLQREAAGGERFELERMAYYIVDRLPAFPTTPAAIDIPASAGDFFGVDGIPVVSLTPEVMPHDWLTLGPLPKGTSIPDSAALRLQAGSVVGEHGTATPLPREHLQIGYNIIVYWSDRPPKTYTIDLGGFSGKKPSANYFYTVLSNSRSRTLEIRFDARGPVEVNGWLGGKPVKNGDIVRLAAGFHPFLIRAEVGTIPPFMRNKAVILEMLPREAPDRRAEIATWIAEVAPYEAILTRITTAMPESTEAGKARHLLSQLARGREELGR